jgi:hypothetical protein
LCSTVNRLTREYPRFSSLGQLWDQFFAGFDCKVTCGLRGAEEVDETEDYEAPGSNPGQEL